MLFAKTSLKSSIFDTLSLLNSNFFSCSKKFSIDEEGKQLSKEDENHSLPEAYLFSQYRTYSKETV